MAKSQQDLFKLWTDKYACMEKKSILGCDLSTRSRFKVLMPMQKMLCQGKQVLKNRESIANLRARNTPWNSMMHRITPYSYSISRLEAG
jgi:hypothetical protein